MKTLKFTTAILTLSLVFFMSTISIANTGNFHTGDLFKSTDKSVSVSLNSRKDLSYLRFDVNRYIRENVTTEATHSSLDYLRFNVNDFITINDGNAMELPITNEFEYLRFDSNNFTEINSDSIIELPLNEFDYLRFDVNTFVTAGDKAVDELPETK